MKTAAKILKNCLKCNIFSVSVFRREELLLLSTRDLRYFLLSKDISIKDCKERYHLVDLIMKFAGDNGQTSVTDLRREENRRAHVENLRLEAQRREVVEEQARQEHSNEEVSVNSDEYEQNLPGTPLDLNRPVPRKWKSIEDICSLDDVDSLSVRELKKILTINFIDYKGCFEKSELTERVKRLWNSKNTEQRARPQSKSNNDDSKVYDEDLCKICMDSAIDCVLLDCGHLVSCVKCGRRLHECPICRQLVARVVHVFKA